MIRLDLADIAVAVDGELLAAPGAGVGSVERVVTDTRDPELPDALFVALRTTDGDGHEHLEGALRGGARAALVDLGVGHSADGALRPSVEDLPRIVVDDTWRALRSLAVEVRRRVAPTVVAITGSYGKTTTKDLARGAIATTRRTIAAPGSFNNELGVPRTMLLLRPDSEVLVAEVGARHVGDIAEMAALLEPDVAIVTAVAGVHLEVFGTIDDVARGKRELVESLGRGGTAVLNADDPRVAAMASSAPAVLTYSLGGVADVVARSVRLDGAAHAHVAVDGPWGPVELRVPLPGRHHVPNALAALTAAGVVGVPMEEAAAGIARAAVSPWRCEVTRAGDLTLVNDAYNASPDTVRAALDLLLDLPVTGRRIAVLGEMAELGDETVGAHRAVGLAAAERGLDALIVVARPESPAARIADGAREGGLPSGQVHLVDSVEDAQRIVTATLGGGDAVLVKASRVAGLERLVERLRTALEGPAAA